MTLPINHLRSFFKISTAAFNFQKLAVEAIGGTYSPNRMEDLHRQALIEIEKEEPDLGLMDQLLAQMEICADQNANKIPKYPEGKG